MIAGCFAILAAILSIVTGLMRSAGNVDFNKKEDPMDPRIGWFIILLCITVFNAYLFYKREVSDAMAGMEKILTIAVIILLLKRIPMLLDGAVHPLDIAVILACLPPIAIVYGRWRRTE